MILIERSLTWTDNRGGSAFAPAPASKKVR